MFFVFQSDPVSDARLDGRSHDIVAHAEDVIKVIEAELAAPKPAVEFKV